MFLKYRPTRLTDLEECSACVRDAAPYDPAARRDLLAFWREGLQNKTLHMLLMEDLDAAPGQRILYFVCKACVPARFAAELQTGDTHSIGRYVVSLWQCGQSPLLTRPQISRINSGATAHGLHMMTVHFGTPCLRGGQDSEMVMKKLVEWAVFCTSGFRLQEYLIEAFGPHEWALCEGLGLRLRRDSERATDNRQCLPPENRPLLYGINSDEARQSPGTVAGVMFQWNPPRFFCTPAEQELLLYALAGDTDNQLAQQMSLASITIKKRWESIYCRVDRVAPEVLGPAVAQQATARRGGEKKRRLLAYLRHHMEELRPLPPLPA